MVVDGRDRRGGAAALPSDRRYPMNILHVASEIFPPVKTGGLADVVGALPVAQADRGHDVRVLVPGYPAILQAGRDWQPIFTDADLFHGGPAQLLYGRADGVPVPLYVLDCGARFYRQGDPYRGPDGADWPDNLERFAALAWAAARLGLGGDPFWQPDLLHTHDWQAALAPAYLRTLGADGARPPTVLTIHNLAFQGRFPTDRAATLALGSMTDSGGPAEYYGTLNFLKAGIVLSELVTTVSRTYAEETCSPGMGQGLDGLLAGRGADYRGVVNGIDDAQWNPLTDPHLPQVYDAASVGPGKAAAKAAVRSRFGLASDDDGPLAIVISRMTYAKGLDLILSALPGLIDQGWQLAVLGSGEPWMQDGFRTAAATYPGRVGVQIGYDEGLSHLMQGGGDVIAVPSREEPCGLTQLYGLRYGTLPVVRRTGGLADTVVNADAAAVAAGTANGFAFDDATPQAVAGTFAWVAETYANRGLWRGLQATAMVADHGWGSVAADYDDLYRDALSRG